MGAPPSPDAGGHAPHACLDEELDPAELAMLRNVQRKFIACTYRGGGAAGGNRGDLIKLFRLLDTDHSGTLDHAELRAAVRKRLGIPPAHLSDGDLGRVIALLDTHGEGVVTVSESGAPAPPSLLLARVSRRERAPRAPRARSLLPPSGGVKL